jgi:hypothetical protein
MVHFKQFFTLLAVYLKIKKLRPVQYGIYFLVKLTFHMARYLKIQKVAVYLKIKKGACLTNGGLTS